MHAKAPRLLQYGGTFVAVVTVGLLHAHRHGYGYTGSQRFAWSLAYVLLLAFASYGAGLPDLSTGARAVPAALKAVVIAALAISIAQLFVGDALLPRLVVFGSAVVLVPWYLLCALLAASGREVAGERDRVLLVGRPDEAELLRHDLAVSAERPAQLAAVVDPADVAGGAGDRHLLREAAAESRANILVLSREAQAEERIVHQAALLHESGVRVRTLSLFYEQWMGKLPVSELERVALFFDIGEVHRAVYGRASRLFDLVVAVALLAAFVVVLPVVVVGDLIANRGPLFYRQPRIGKGGTVFDIVKFRTMTPGPDSLRNEWTMEDDPRITPFGRVLRLTHVDELPQALNIFRGDLSVVGPRPEQPHYVEELVAKLPFYDLRHLVRPGLTGWAQVKYGYAGNEADALEKLQFEFYYLRHQSLVLDARIIGRTVRTVLNLRGR